MESSGQYSFGPFSFDPSSGLSRGDTDVSLPPKENGLLELLLRHDGSIVSYRQIEQELWPDRSASYASIARAVYSLRRSLGGDRACFVVTVPKRGYKMGVPITWAPSPVNLSVVETSTAEKAARSTSRGYSNYIEGLHEANLGSAEGLRRAVELFEQAHRHDPGFAVALSAMADCRMYQAIRGYLHPSEALKLGQKACDQALQIDPRLASAHATSGWFVGVMERSVEAGLDQVSRALALDPQYARGYSYMGWVQRSAGLVRDSVASARRAAELDPHSILSRHGLAWALFCGGHPEEALAIERRERVERPGIDMGHSYTALIAGWLGFFEEAVCAARDAARISSQNPALMTSLSYALARAGAVDEARRIATSIAAAETPRAPRPHLAMSWVALGETERALGLLSIARDENCPWFSSARFDPRIGELAQDRRLKAMYG